MKGTSGKLFGGVHMVVYGDMFQLGPVYDSWVFAKPT